MSRSLSSEEMAHFHREGFAVVPDLFDASDLQPVIEEISAEIDERAAALVKTGVLSHDYSEFGFATRLAHISRETDQVALAIWNGTLSGPAFFDLIKNPRLLDVAEQLCGEELIASSVYRLRPKIPHYNYGAVPWHQDSGYFEPYCDKALVVTVWLPLVDATMENGCLWVLPRAHHGGVLPHTLDEKTGAYLSIPEEELPVELQPVCVPVPKGGVLLMTNRTPHVSHENQTEQVRWSMDLRYQSASLPTNARITRLENESAPDQTLGIPAACYPPEADFLVRSRQHPAEIIQSAEDFDALRKNHIATPISNRWDVTWVARKDA